MTQAKIFLQDQNRYVRFYLSMYFKKKRAELGLSPDDVASLLQVPIQTYRKIESGRMRLSEPLFESLIATLSLRSEELFEIGRLANVAYANALSAALSSNYPV